ncbi:hypothetical protein ILP92_14820 [Maribius pontilimi]|uniref:Uncharacterized protein n=1 Tax=Palleronia pontilimi TaxID=1964209 RepID=A0A934IIK4_9RHOB|nr:hypothetical protein [Palleronia pontilimi]MBJ3764020.1 hypothetical protein [Palleronia pontilimi]
MTDVDTCESFTLAAPGLGVEIPLDVPRACRALLSVTLAGWDIVPARTGITPQIVIRRDGGYALQSPHYTPARAHSDLVSTLNELLIAIAFGVSHARPDDHLLHAAAYRLDGRNVVLTGGKKAGKSVRTVDMAARGALIYGDDLLLWSPARLCFVALGLSPRLRRPVDPATVARFGPDGFLAGHATCYLSVNAFDLAPAGRSFSADRIEVLSPGGQTRPVRFWNVRRELARRKIR